MVYYKLQDIDEKYKKVVRVYKDFLILNKSFINAKDTNDIILPDEIKSFDERKASLIQLGKQKGYVTYE